mmetsp:Transcript_20075/g.49951  ORF Transcript_20075/g.49951 Transcript_20075/m.49951 type:complete len:151 (+) Transcript_20075:455-907(+)
MHFLSSALLVMALGLLSSTTESFSPRSLAATAPSSSTSLFVSISEDSIVGDGTLPQKTSVAAVPKVAQRWRKSTKQLATLGPSSSNKEMIEKVCGNTWWIVRKEIHVHVSFEVGWMVGLSRIFLCLMLFFDVFLLFSSPAVSSGSGLFSS